LEDSNTLDLAEKSPFTDFTPTKYLRIGGTILIIALFLGLFLPGFVAWQSGMFYDWNAKQRLASINRFAQQARELQDFEASRGLLEKAVKALDKKLSTYAILSPVPDDAKVAVELQQQLRARLDQLRAPIQVSGFYFSSTMLLWPIVFTCLGWVAFLLPPNVGFAAFRTHSKMILVFTIGISLLYWPTLARNLVFNEEGRVFFGIANLDMDPAGFLVQEGLSFTVSFLLAVIWTKWICLFAMRNRELSLPTEDPIAQALDWSTVARLSRTFMQWQVCSVVLACGFVPYIYFFWDAVLRIRDQRYLIAAITVQLLWATTWIIISLPLAATYYAWQSTRVAALCAAGEKALEKVEGIDTLVDTITSLEPINPWNLAVTSIAFFVSFIGPIVQHLHV